MYKRQVLLDGIDHRLELRILLDDADDRKGEDVYKRQEYRQHIEKDAALERRFQPVHVGEPTEEEAVQILQGLKDRYEAHHKVQITDEAIESAVKLSSRYIADRYLPDKAIDLVDEAASRVRLRTFTAPEDLQELEKRIKEVELDKAAAVNEQDFELSLIHI